MTDIEQIAHVVELIWSMATTTEPDLTGIGHKQIAMQYIEQLVANERQRCANIAEGWTDTTAGRAILENILATTGKPSEPTT